MLFHCEPRFRFLLHFTAWYKWKRYLPQYENNIAIIVTDITDEYIRLSSIDTEFYLCDIKKS